MIPENEGNPVSKGRPLRTLFPMAIPLLLSLVSLSACSTPFRGDEAPIELGVISWNRDHDAAFSQAKQAERPVLILFQEIPG